jgi:hypothetical protein
VGTGIHLPITKELKFSAAFSPLFIPTMSPALRLSETQDATGARFTRLPPTRFQLPSGTILPLRYRLETGQITDIVFQNQAFLGMAYETNAVRASLMTWSGPSASPEVDATGDIPILQETSAVAFAVARPRFPRQNFVGATFGLPSVIASPEMQAILEMRSARWTLSAKLTPVETPSLQIHTGFLSRIAQASSTGASSSGTPGLSSPDYATRASSRARIAATLARGDPWIRFPSEHGRYGEARIQETLGHRCAVAHFGRERHSDWLFGLTFLGRGCSRSAVRGRAFRL